MTTTETSPQQFAADFLTLIESVRPDGIIELIDDLERARAELAPLLERADEMLEHTRAMAHELIDAMSARDRATAAKVEEFINQALRRSQLYDVLSDLAIEVDPEEMYRSHRLAEDQEGEPVISDTITVTRHDNGGRPDGYRCQTCGKAWEIDRDPEIDNESMMTERIAEHFCFPGVSIDQVDAVWQAAQDIAEALPVRPEDRSSYPENWTPEQVAQVCEEADRTSTAGEGLAIRFDCDLALLATATIDRAPSPPTWKSLLWIAENAARRSALTDEQRARALAHMIVFGIPAGASSFHPRHARMALDFLAEESAKVATEHPNHPRTPPEAARAWLVDFEQRAHALL